MSGRSAFTVVEVVLAVMVFCTLLAMVVNLYSSSARQAQKMEKTNVSFHTWIRASELLRSDLAGSTDVKTPDSSTLDIVAVHIEPDLSLKTENVSWRLEGNGKAMVRDSAGQSLRFDFSDGLERDQKIALQFKVLK
jgi:type II secretory pathway component PulJ